MLIPGWDQIHVKNLGNLHGVPEGTKLWAWGRVLPVDCKWEWAGAINIIHCFFFQGTLKPGLPTWIFIFGELRRGRKRDLHKARVGLKGGRIYSTTIW